MPDAPWVSTFIAVALIPVAFLFTHAYLSGRRKLPYHKLTGTVGIVWDLSLSTFYMLFRLAGTSVEGSILDITPGLVVYFAVHGIVAVIVIAMELTILGTGIVQWRTRKPMKLHKRLSNPLYLLWFVTFLSGEAIYLIYYVF
ncbi:MAG: hypothetical protein MUO81_07890 [Thermoplasmata archaeon]|nr:hypothetical protein [Thermoplasmata archaeon]